MLQYLNDPIFFVTLFLSIVVALTIHEFAHAATALALGDPTAKLAGRLTLDPRKHLDPFGTLALVIAGFGWAKPVPFSPAALRPQRAGPALVAIAGPISNLLQAFVAASILNYFGPDLGFLYRTLYVFLYLNIALAVFNMIPIPPLDGSRLLTALLPPSKQHIAWTIDRYGMLILLLLMFTGLLRLLQPIIQLLVTLITSAAGL